MGIDYSYPTWDLCFMLQTLELSKLQKLNFWNSKLETEISERYFETCASQV